MNPPAKSEAPTAIFCAGHQYIRQDLSKLQDTQARRPCGDHEARISGLEDSDEAQWKDIKDLQRTVWKGVGMLMGAGFFGSIIGSVVVHLIWK